MNNNKFDFKPVDEIYVRKLLNNINVQKATGYDNFPPKMVKGKHQHIIHEMAEWHDPLR